MLANGEFVHLGHLLPFRPPLTLRSTKMNGCLKLGSAEAALHVAFWVFVVTIGTHSGGGGPGAKLLR